MTEKKRTDYHREYAKKRRAKKTWKRPKDNPEIAKKLNAKRRAVLDFTATEPKYSEQRKQIAAIMEAHNLPSMRAAVDFALANEFSRCK